MSNKIIKREYYALELQVASPLNIAGSDTMLTDRDIIRNWDGEAFIPGSSVAGAFRGYLEDKGVANRIFGYTDGDKGHMSPVVLSDICFLSSVNTTIRDNVCLDKEQHVSNKFDCEIIETGASGMLYIEYTMREQDSEDDFECSLEQVIIGLQKGEIRFGARKNRGFGKISICRIYKQEFDSGKLDAWIKFQEDYRNLNTYEAYTYEAWLEKRTPISRKFLQITVPLKQVGGISIRQYSARPERADFEHITCNNKPVIPGASWSGVFRSAAEELLEDLEESHPEELLDLWFGYVRKKEALQSQVIFEESQLESAVSIPMTRNRISRFDASSEEGALYSEIAYFDGNTELNILIAKKGNYLALAGLILLLVRDLQKGYLAVGGQTAVGRGVFKANGDIAFSEPALTTADCESALSRCLMKRKEKN